MRIVADTGSPHYLVLIGKIGLLPQLFETVHIPEITALGFETTGTLGVLDRAARRGLIDLADAFVRLKATNFRYQPRLLDALLARHGKRK